MTTEEIINEVVSDLQKEKEDRVKSLVRRIVSEQREVEKNKEIFSKRLVEIATDLETIKQGDVDSAIGKYLSANDVFKRVDGDLSIGTSTYGSSPIYISGTGGF